MKKKFCACITLFGLILTMIVVLASCGDTSENETTTSAQIEKNTDASLETTEAPHSHIWSDWITILDATCVAEGKQERSCSCGEKESQSISESGHIESSWIMDQEPTCASLGYQHKECTVCGTNLESQNLAKLAHTEVIDPAVLATCLASGRTEGKHCSVCQAVIVKQKSISKLNHVESDWITDKEPTCTNIGSAHKECTVCGTNLERQNLAKLSHVESDWIIDKEATCTAQGSKHIECLICQRRIKTEGIDKNDNHTGLMTDEGSLATCGRTGVTEGKHCTACKAVIAEQQTLEATGNHIYEGNFCLGCGKISPDFSFPTGYITTQPIEIETEYCILRIEENIYVVDDVANKVDIVCRALEEVTGLKFKNDSYGKDKVVINVTHGTGKQGASGEDELPFTEFTVDFTREITICPRSLFIAHSRSLIHELAHALHFSQTKWRPNKIFIEGFATYATYLTTQYMAEKYPHIQQSFVTPDYEIFCWEIYTEELYREKIEYWFEKPFKHMPHYHSGYEYYTIGFRIMWYLHDTYGDYTQWILFRESTNPASDHYNAKTEMYRDIEIGNEALFSEIKQIYSIDVLDGFYPWLKAHENMFEYDRMSREFLDLTDIEYITIYPMFDYTTYFVETSAIIYDDLYINIEEAKKYLREYKGKDIRYMRFSTLNGGRIPITYYDKDGNILYESDNVMTWVDEKVSYVKLNGCGKVENLEITGIADYMENGLAFRAHYPNDAQDWNPHYDLYYVYDYVGTHLIIPAEVNGFFVKKLFVYNHDAIAPIQTITELTISEGIEALHSNSFRFYKVLKTIHLPATLNYIDNDVFSGENVEIYYAGTLNDWEAIPKETKWDRSLTSYTIYCIDGIVEKGNE